MIKICHASIDENGKARGGKSGDQTRKEVCTRTWYNKNWKVCLRYPDEKIAYTAANISQLLADSDQVGYDQNERNTLHRELQKNAYDISAYLRSGVLTETDCSAFVTACFIAAGVGKLEYTGNAPVTSTMESVFQKAGFEVLKDSKYLKSDEYLKKGDVLVCNGHTVLCIESGARAFTTSSTFFFSIPPIKTLSLSDALASIGADNSKAYRERIWKVNNQSGIYSGTASQNTALLKLLYSGYLIIP